MGMEGDYRKEHSKKKKPYSMFLVKTKYNWADEIDVEGFCLMRPAEYAYLLREIEAIEYPIEWMIGSNQGVEFESAEEILKKFDVSVLSLKEVNSLRNILHIHTLDEYGHTPFGSIQGNAPREWYDKNPHAEEEDDE